MIALRTQRTDRNTGNEVNTMDLTSFGSTDPLTWSFALLWR
jgi:hypothetical protein